MSLTVSPDHKYPALGGLDPVVQIWHVATGKLLATYPMHTSSVWRLTWSPNGTCIASGSKREVYVWRAR